MEAVASEALEEAHYIVLALPDGTCVLRRVHGEQHGIVEGVVTEDGAEERKVARVVQGLSVKGHQSTLEKTTSLPGRMELGRGVGRS